jgi:general secretion pathway protein I
MRGGLSRRKGFTLIEALVAFAILAMSMSSLLAGVSGGAHNEARADFLLRATRLGRSQLASLGADAPLTPGVTAGRYDDGLLWRLSVEPHGDVKSATGGVSAVAYLARLTVSRAVVRPTAQDQLDLTTIRVVAAQEAGK